MEVIRAASVLPEVDVLPGTSLGGNRRMQSLADALGLPCGTTEPSRPNVVIAAFRAAIDACAGERRRAQLRHSRFPEEEEMASGPRANVVALDAYRRRCRPATDERDQNSQDLWRDRGRIESQLLAMAPVLRYVNTVRKRSAPRQGEPYGSAASRPGQVAQATGAVTVH